MIAPSWHPTKSELRQFGIAALFAFGLLGLILKHQFDLTTAPWVVWGIGLFAGVIGLAAPFKVYPLYLLVTLIGMPIGLVVSNLVLGIIYFVIMTPLGWALRLTGRDPLRLKKPAGESFWVTRTLRRDAASYYRQS